MKFHKADEQVADHTPRALEEPAPVPPVKEEEDRIQSREKPIDIVMAKSARFTGSAAWPAQAAPAPFALAVP